MEYVLAAVGVAAVQYGGRATRRPHDRDPAELRAQDHVLHLVVRARINVDRVAGLEGVGIGRQEGGQAGHGLIGRLAAVDVVARSRRVLAAGGTGVDIVVVAGGRDEKFAGKPRDVARAVNGHPHHVLTARRAGNRPGTTAVAGGAQAHVRGHRGPVAAIVGRDVHVHRAAGRKTGRVPGDRRGLSHHQLVQPGGRKDLHELRRARCGTGGISVAAQVDSSAIGRRLIPPARRGIARIDRRRVALHVEIVVAAAVALKLLDLHGIGHHGAPGIFRRDLHGKRVAGDVVVAQVLPHGPRGAVAGRRLGLVHVHRGNRIAVEDRITGIIVSGRGRPGGTDLIPARRDVEGVSSNVRGGCALQVIVVEPAAAADQSPRAAGDEAAGTVVVDDLRRLARVGGRAETENAVRAGRLDEFGIGADAVGVETRAVDPVGQGVEVLPRPGDQPARAAGIQVVVVAGEGLLAVGRHVQGIAGLRPEDVVFQRDAAAVVFDVDTVAQRLIDRVVDKLGAAPIAGDVAGDEYPLVEVGIDQVVAELVAAAAIYLHARSVAVDGVALDDVPGVLHIDSRLAIVIDRVVQDLAVAVDSDAVVVIMHHVLLGRRAVPDFDAHVPTARLPVHRIVGHLDVAIGIDTRLRIIVDDVAADRDPGHFRIRVARGDAGRGGVDRVAVDRDFLAGHGNARLRAVDRVAGQCSVVVGRVQKDAIAGIAVNLAVGNREVRAAGRVGGVDAVVAAGDRQVLQRHAGGPRQLEHVLAAAGVAAVQDGNPARGTAVGPLDRNARVACRKDDVGVQVVRAAVDLDHVARAEIVICQHGLDRGLGRGCRQAVVDIAAGGIDIIASDRRNDRKSSARIRQRGSGPSHTDGITSRGRVGGNGPQVLAAVEDVRGDVRRQRNSILHELNIDRARRTVAVARLQAPPVDVKGLARRPDLAPAGRGDQDVAARTQRGLARVAVAAEVDVAPVGRRFIGETGSGVAAVDGRRLVGILGPSAGEQEGKTRYSAEGRRK